jgi:hypothetical protein
MGKLIVLPSRGEEALHTAAELRNEPCEFQLFTDLAAWQYAPRERTPNYFAVYSAVSRAMQAAMRRWVREWLAGNKEILQRPHTAYAILVYQCTHPFAGKPTNIFTYEIQQTETLYRAFRSAASKLGRSLKVLDTKRLPWFTREYYFAYRSELVVKYVSKNPRGIYRMLHVETMLMDAILRFSITDIPTIGIDEALIRLRRTFKTQLHRFSENFDLSPHSDELLQIATAALIAKMAAQYAEEVSQAA